MRTKSVHLFLAGLSLGVGLAACSSSSQMTCQEYSNLPASKQTATVIKMVRDHGLDPYSSVWGTARIGADLELYCGMVGGSAFGAEATKNLTSPIENAIDRNKVAAD